MELAMAMTRFGHLASRRQLATVGIGRHILDRELREGVLLPVRAGWVATQEADQLAVVAVLRGARLTGATALRSYGVWAGDDRRSHFQVPPNAHRICQVPLTPIARFTAPRFVPHGTVMHWAPSTPIHTGAQWRVSIADAIIRFAVAESDEQIVAAIESAVHEKQLSRNGVAELLRRLPRRHRRLAPRLNLLAGSGMETIVRMRLEALQLRVAQQVRIGIDRVDLVIDGWLVVEVDGDEWHNPTDDRIRTNRVIRAGYRMLRFGHKEVFERWDETVATIFEMLGRSSC